MQPRKGEIIVAALLTAGVSGALPRSRYEFLRRDLEAARGSGRLGRIHVLVNTVGAWRGGKPVHENDLADWDFMFNGNLRTTLSFWNEVTGARVDCQS